MIRAKIFRENFVIKCFIGGFLLLLIAIIGMFIGTTWVLKTYQTDEIVKYANLIGIIQEKSSNSEEILPYVTEEKFSERHIEEGLIYLKKYGYEKGMSLNNKWLGRDFLKTRSNIVGVSIMLFVMFFVFLIAVLCLVFKKLNDASEALERIGNGEQDVKLNGNKEGALGLLNHRVNMVNDRMTNWIEEIDEERNSLKELLNDLSHQLKTPIASLKMNTELILDGYTDREETMEFLEDNQENIERLKWITEGLLKLSRLESKFINLNRRQDSLKNTVLAAITSTSGKAISKNIEVEIEGLEECIFNHDKRWTTEAIINVIDNAIKYSEEIGKIKICLKNYKWKYEIKIEDFGCGINKGEVDKIFKRFYRSFDENVQKVEGSGIGLYLTKLIVDGQDGNIKVESTLESTCFIISFYPHIIDN